MNFGTVLISIAAGVIAGWLAATVSKDGSFGAALDMVLGIGGSTVATVGAWILMAPDSGIVKFAFVALLGAIGAVVAQRQLRPAPPVARVRVRARATPTRPVRR